MKLFLKIKLGKYQKKNIKRKKYDLKIFMIIFEIFLQINFFSPQSKIIDVKLMPKKISLLFSHADFLISFQYFFLGSKWNSKFNQTHKHTRSIIKKKASSIISMTKSIFPSANCSLLLFSIPSLASSRLIYDPKSKFLLFEALLSSISWARGEIFWFWNISFKN